MNASTLSGWMAALVAAAALSCGDPQPGVDDRPAAGGREAVIPDDRETRELLRSIEVAQLIFVGPVLEVGEPPLAALRGGGYHTARQRATHRADEVWRGDAEPGSEVRVYYWARGGSKIAGPGTDVLSEELFEPGSQLIVLAAQVTPGSRWVNVHSDHGVHRATPENERRLRELFRKVEAGELRSGLAPEPEE